MGIQDYRLHLEGIPGFERLVMRTVHSKNGNELDEFSIDGHAVQVRAGASQEEVKQAFLDALKK